MGLQFTWLFVFKALVLGFVFMGVTIFVLKKVLFDSTQGAVNRLNRETEDVRKKQAELNERIKQANEELAQRRKEADALLAKMKQEAEEKATEEREKILKKARADGEEIIAKAQRTKDDMRKALEKEAEVKIMDFTVILLEEVLSKRTHGAFNENLLNDFLDELKEIDMSMITEDLTSADVVVSEPLTDNFKNRLSDVLKQKLGRVIQFNVTVDESIISGIVLKFGSLSLNGSLQYLLDDKGTEIKEKLEKGLLEKVEKKT